MAGEIPNITVVIGTNNDAISVDQAQGPLKVSTPLIVKPANTTGVQAIPIDGDANPIGHLAVIRTGEIDLARYRAVTQRPNGKVTYLDPTDQDDKNSFVGVTLNPAAAGRPTTVVTQGIMSDPDWTWTAGPIHSGPNGVLTQTISNLTFPIGEVITPTTIIVGRSGTDAGPGGGAETFVWEAPSASTTWTINHNLQRNPSVTLTDSTGRVMLADVTYLNINTVTVEFAYATAGYAYLV